MSSITYTALDPANHAWMVAGDSLLEIDEGQHIGKCILVNTVQNDVDTNFDGSADQVNVKVTARLVDKTDGSTITVGTSHVIAPAKVESALMSAIAEGDVVVSVWMANMIDDAIHRVLRQQSALGAISMIPTGV